MPVGFQKSCGWPPQVPSGTSPLWSPCLVMDVVGSSSHGSNGIWI